MPRHDDFQRFTYFSQTRTATAYLLFNPFLMYVLFFYCSTVKHPVSALRFFFCFFLIQNYNCDAVFLSLRLHFWLFQSYSLHTENMGTQKGIAIIFYCFVVSPLATAELNRVWPAETAQDIVAVKTGRLLCLQHVFYSP